MFRYLLILAMSLQVAFCPIVCRTAPATTADCRLPGERPACVDGDSCHDCCRPRGCPADCESDDPAPQPACPCDCMGHVCVWSGAIVEKTDFDRITLTTLLGRTPPTTILLPHVTAAPLSFACDEALPLLSGRQVRALLCSLLC
jgi:hypothetical protein